jgi:predicted RNase H-like HicB family nuclease
MKVRDIIKRIGGADPLVLGSPLGTTPPSACWHPAGPQLSCSHPKGRSKIVNMKDAKYTAIYAKTKTGYSAHIPDLPGCIATGRTLELTKRRMREAVALHLQGMREDGETIPQPTTQADEIEAA